MPEAIFYIIKQTSNYANAGQDIVLAKLCRRHVKAQKVVLLCEDESVAKHYDDLLWAFSPTSFLPHGVDDVHANLVLTANATKLQSEQIQQALIINTAQNAALDAQGKVIEVIAADDASKAAGRLRYKAYAGAGFSMSTHEI